MSTYNTILFYYSSQHPIKLKTNERPWSRGKTKTIFYRWNINPQVQYLNIWWCGNIISIFHSLQDSIIGMSALTRWLFCHQTFDFMEHKLFSLCLRFLICTLYDLLLISWPNLCRAQSSYATKLSSGLAQLHKLTV